MIVSADTRDIEGLKTGEEYSINFIPDIPFLNVLSFLPAGSPVADTIYSDILLPVRVNPGTGEFSFSVRFSLPFSWQEKQATALKITLIPFFPKTLAPVALQKVNWASDDRLSMCWEGLTAGDNITPHYYKLTIPGGKNGIVNGIGMYMKEDITIYLEAVDD
jgi:hypothetical protein